MIDGTFDENPAKWTGNGSRMAKPDINDWYETVKVNYGIRPDGSKDFPQLPEGFDKKSYKEHFDFWNNKDVPSSWKNSEILLCIGQLKALMVFVMIWQKWCLMNFGVI